MAIEKFDDDLAVERPDVHVDDPINMRPDLSELGIHEVERGVCEDNYVNRSTLRRARMGWDPVYASNGVPTGLIQARSPKWTERAEFFLLLRSAQFSLSRIS